MASEIKISRKISFSIFILVIFFFVLEEGARLFDRVYPDEIDLGIEVSKKKPGSFRIFLYGGSTVAGEPEIRFGFVKQLTFWLNETHQGKPFELINFAVSGKDSTFVRKMVDRTTRYEPDLIIVMSAHNEFLLDSLGQKGWRENTISSFAFTRLLYRVKEKIFGDGSRAKTIVKLSSGKHRAIDRESELFTSRVKNYQKNIKAIVRTAGKSDIPLLFLTAPYNMADWPPVYKELEGYNPDYKARISEAVGLIDKGRLGAAKMKVALMEKGYPNDAMSFFLKARLKRAGGDYNEARELFKKAKDLDPIPWRSLSLFNDTLREVAAREDGVYLLDVMRLFEENSYNGLVGFNLIADNCHPTPVGNALISAGIFRLMKKHALFAERPMPEISAADRWKYFLSKVMDDGERDEVEYGYLLSNAKYTMKSPFYNFAASRMYLKRALALNPSDWRVWANLATISLFEGKVLLGKKELRKAASLRGAPIDVGDRFNIPHLFEALKLRGLAPQSGADD